MQNLPHRLEMGHVGNGDFMTARQNILQTFMVQ